MESSLKERYRNLGLNIAYYRKLRGLSQEKLAEKADISRTHMSRVETADCAVSLDVVFHLADALGWNPISCFRVRNDRIPGESPAFCENFAPPRLHFSDIVPIYYKRVVE